MVAMIQEDLALDQITRAEVEHYAADSDTSTLYAALDDLRRIYAVLDVPHWPRKLPAGIVVMARVVDEYVIIEEDTTDKPLVDALMTNGGVPRERIILAYAGEKMSA
jgi:hypothetical protein